MRFRHKAAALAATLALPLAGLVGLASPAQAATSATATFAKTSDWGTGFGGSWTVKNTGTTSLSSWTVEWDFPTGTKVTSAWDATVTNSGDHWTAKNVGWNGTLAPGASVSFGFNGSGPGSPSNCKLNGGSCDGTSVPGDAALRARHAHRLQHHRHLGEAVLVGGDRRQGRQELRRPAGRREGRHRHRHHLHGQRPHQGHRLLVQRQGP